METLFTIDNLISLGMLTLLQAVLGFDNLLYISIESKRVAEEEQAYVRKIGIINLHTLNQKLSIDEFSYYWNAMPERSWNEASLLYCVSSPQ